MTHEVDILPQEYSRILLESRTFIVRKDDGFQMGDLLLLKEFDPSPQNATDKAPRGYTGSKDLERECGYIEHISGNVIISIIKRVKDA